MKCWPWFVGLSVRLSLLPMFFVYCSVCVDYWEKNLANNKKRRRFINVFCSVSNLLPSLYISSWQVKKIGLRAALFCVWRWLQLDKVLRYKPECPLFSSSHNMSLTSNQTLSKNENQRYLLGRKGGRYIGLTILPPSCAYYVEILGA